MEEDDGGKCKRGEETRHSIPGRFGRAHRQPVNNGARTDVAVLQVPPPRATAIGYRPPRTINGESDSANAAVVGKQSGGRRGRGARRDRGTGERIEAPCSPKERRGKVYCAPGSRVEDSSRVWAQRCIQKRMGGFITRGRNWVALVSERFC